MSYFTVDQLFEFSFSGKLLYNLPASIKTMLVELESVLEITDAASEQPERKEYRFSDSKHAATDSSAKYRNRYEFDSSRRDRDGGKDKKKRDMKPALAKPDATADSSWEAIRSFKPTKIGSKVGIEKTVNDLRIALNKISATNYDKQRDAVFTLVDEYFVSDEQSESNNCRIAKVIFDIASANKFYSEMYAKLYKELIYAYSIFAALLAGMVDKFIELDAIPVYVDPDVDYDGFCDYSKECESRKTTSTFIVNCFKLDLVKSQCVAKILFEFVRYVDEKRMEGGFSKSVEGVVENIYIIATMCSSELSKTEQWGEYILPKLKEFADSKVEFPSISSRTKFKFLDILDNIKP